MKVNKKARCLGCELGLKNHMCDERLKEIKRFADETLEKADRLLQKIEEEKFLSSLKE